MLLVKLAGLPQLAQCKQKCVAPLGLLPGCCGGAPSFSPPGSRRDRASPQRALCLGGEDGIGPFKRSSVQVVVGMAEAEGAPKPDAEGKTKQAVPVRAPQSPVPLGG